MPSYALHLVRHGLAGERGPEWPDDTLRPLTKVGAARMRRAARGLDALGVQFDLIVTSPLVRAAQSAEQLRRGMTDHPPIEIADALAPGGAASALFRLLARHRGATSVALVGHEPDLGELAARLVGARTAIPFKKGAICRIDVDALPPRSPGQLRWFATPRMLRMIRRKEEGGRRKE